MEMGTGLGVNVHAPSCVCAFPIWSTYNCLLNLICKTKLLINIDVLAFLHQGQSRHWSWSSLSANWLTSRKWLCPNQYFHPCKKKRVFKVISYHFVSFSELVFSPPSSSATSPPPETTDMQRHPQILELGTVSAAAAIMAAQKLFHDGWRKSPPCAESLKYLQFLASLDRVGIHFFWNLQTSSRIEPIEDADLFGQTDMF